MHVGGVYECGWQVLGSGVHALPLCCSRGDGEVDCVLEPRMVEKEASCLISAGSLLMSVMTLLHRAHDA
jgi:hypothetical protein